MQPGRGNTVAAVEVSTIAAIGPTQDRDVRRRRLLYTATTVALTALMVIGVGDALGWWSVYGVSTARRSATSGQYTLSVRYPTVSRPALASQFEIDVSSTTGFDGPVTIAITLEYLTLWDENGLVPAPDGETTDGDRVLWEFAPPTGTTLHIFYDARIEPTAQSGQDATVALVVDDVDIIEVDIETEVRP